MGHSWSCVPATERQKMAWEWDCTCIPAGCWALGCSILFTSHGCGQCRGMDACTSPVPRPPRVIECYGAGLEFHEVGVNTCSSPRGAQRGLARVPRPGRT
ncbi:UNVERIFIED_CONTAM: hypothetical protein FKN15_047100 [Acipenser sinensis]